MLNTCARSIRPEQQWRLAARGESQEPEQWWRLSAAEIERAVSASARTMLGDRAAIALVLEESSIDSSHLVPVLRSTQTLIERLQADGETASSTPGEIIERVDLMCEASGSYLSCRSQRKTATVQRATSLSPG
jgi:hypothetical protein